MAKKKQRINVKFIGIGVGILLALGLIGVVLRKTVLRPGPDKYVAAAKQDMQAGRWDDAVKNVGSAIRYSKAQDASLWTMYGDVMLHRTATDKDALNQAKGAAYPKALEIDPTNKVATRALIKIYRDELAMGTAARSAGDFDGLHDFSVKALAVDPNDNDARMIGAWSIIERWRRGIQTPQKDVDDAKAVVEDIRVKAPENTDAPSLLLNMKLVEVADVLRSARPAEKSVGVKRIVDECETIINDALKGQDDNAKMQFLAGKAMRSISQLPVLALDRDALGGSATQPVAQPVAGSGATPPKSWVETVEGKAALDKMRSLSRGGLEHLGRAAELIKPTDELFAEIREEYARSLLTPELGMADLKPDEATKVLIEARGKAEKVYVETLRQIPGEQGIRLALAEMIGKVPDRREEAIKLLQDTQPPSPLWVGVRGNFARIMFPPGTYKALCDLRLDQAESAKNKPDKDNFLTEAQSAYDKLVNVVPSGESQPMVLHLKGRLQLAKGQALDGAQTLSRALSLYPRDSANSENLDRLELMVRLAGAYRLTQQTGEAKRLYRDILAVRPAHFLSRGALAELLISEGEMREANQQIDVLAKQFGPDATPIVRLRILTMDRVKEKDKIAPLFAKLPETNNGERADKARLAIQLENRDEAIRLFEAIRKEMPAAADIAVELAQLYNAKGDKASALAVVQQAIEKNPNTKGLTLLLQQLQNPDDAAKVRLTQIEGIADPMRRELAMADYYTQLGNDDQAMAHAQAAEKIAPEDSRVLDALFKAAVQKKDLDKASAYLDRLNRVNPDLGMVYRTRLAIQQGNADAALEQALKLSKARPDFAESWVVLGQALLSKRRYEDAIGAFQQALERQTQNFDAIRLIIECYRQLQRPGEASNDAIGKKATDAKLYIEMGQKLFPNATGFNELAIQWEVEKGDPQKAITPREDAVKAHPDDPQALANLGSTYIKVAHSKDASMAPLPAPGTPPPAPISPADQAKNDAMTKEYMRKARDTFATGAEKFPADPRFGLWAADVSTEIGDVPAGEKLILAVADRDPLKGKPDAAIVVADFYNKANLGEKADKVMSDYFAANPSNVQVQLRLAHSLAYHKKEAEALKVLETANTGDMSVVQTRVEMLSTLRRFDEAAKVIEQAMAIKPSIDLDKLRAKNEIQSGKLPEAKAHIAQLMNAAPSDVENLFLRGMVSMADPNGDVGSAIDDFNKVIALQPTLIEPRLRLTDALAKRNLYEQAIQTLEVAARTSPADKSIRLRLLELYAATSPPHWGDADRLLKEVKLQPTLAKDQDMLRAEAQMWLARKDATRGLDLMRQVFKQAPDNPVNIQAYFNAMTDAKDYKTLQAEIDKASKQFSDTWWLYQYRAIVRKRGNNDPRGALVELKKGLDMAQRQGDDNGTSSIIRAISFEVSPNEARLALQPLAEKDARWQLLLVDILQESRDVSGATAAAEKALQSPTLRPVDLPRALRTAGFLYLTQGETAKAVDVYRRLLKEVPNDPTALNNLANQLSEPGPVFAPAEAVQYSQRVYDQAQADGNSAAMPYIEDTHGWALVQCGKVDEGIDILRKAFERKPLPDISYHLASAFMKKSPPAIVDAERSYLDAKSAIEDLERQKQPVDPSLKSKVEAGLSAVRKLK